MEATKRCPFCSEEILSTAIKCKHCQSDLKGTGAAAGPSMQRVFRAVGAIVAGFVVLVILGRLGGSRDDTTASTAPAPPRPIYRVSAMALWQKYQTNEVATDREIGNSIVQVTGEVGSIDKDFMNKPVVRLVTPNEFESVSVTLSDAEAARAAALRKGQSVTFQCDKIARMVGAPVGTDCRFAAQQ